METCGGDPVKAAKTLQDANIKAKVKIVGFDVDHEGQQQLKKVAEAGEGTYTTVSNQSELQSEIVEKWKPSIGQLVWTQGVTLVDTYNAMKNMNDIYNPLYQLSTNEKIRILDAVRFLMSEKLITEETRAQVSELANQMDQIRQEEFKKIKDEKETEREAARKEIEEKVVAWKAKWQ
ncbi:hypothetical protein JOC77_000820 [Peribacillus deserti]|uniref:Uncharacterized protein n=1 Tax=Peribacillus deserti TaxID=673318 RepID=A0ABS2QE25_9BACI|nr:hypothetical protein [Peribacillus deserti]